MYGNGSFGVEPPPPPRMPGPRRPTRPMRRRLRGLVVAVLCLATVSAAGLWWLRPVPGSSSAPAAAVPAGPVSTTVPALAAQIVGLWKGRDADFPHSLVFRSDGTVLPVRRSEDLLAPAGPPGRYEVDGDHLRIAGATSGTDCDRSYSVQRLAEGYLRLDAVGGDAGSVALCGAAPDATSFVLVRLSPVSRGGQAYPQPPVSEIGPVATTNPLYGTWLLQGSGLLLAVGPTGAPRDVAYRLDARGTIDTVTQGAGRLALDAPGQVRLTSDEGCGDTVLRSVAAAAYVLTARVVTDPCGWFGGRTALTWFLVE